MNRRQHLLVLIAMGSGLVGCRSNQFASIRSPNKPDMVGSHQAGAETFKPLVQQAVGELLARHSTQVIPAGLTTPPGPRKICFVAVENKSAEEIGDFKDQIYQTIDSQIVGSQIFTPVSKRFVDAGLAQTRLRPDLLFVPENLRMFTAVMEQQGEPIDALLYATITSGTTRENQDYQRDYLLTLEMVDVRSGQYDKQSATISKGYYHSRTSRWLSNLGLKH